MRGIEEDSILSRPRLSRIYYRGTFFDYPLKPVNALLGLGPLEAARKAEAVLDGRDDVTGDRHAVPQLADRVDRLVGLVDL